jgi:transglutaminase-like putative cysteine protease
VRVAIVHHTRYRFDRPVRLAPHEIRLHPAPHSRTLTSRYRLSITPANHVVYRHFDPAGNRIARAIFQDATETLAIDVQLEADLQPQNPFDFLLDPAANELPFAYAPPEAAHLAPYLLPAEDGPQLQEWLLRFRSGGADRLDTVNHLVRLNQTVASSIEYRVRHEHGVQGGEETLTKGSGSCRDSGWLLVQLLRHSGVAARFVSGYLVQLSGVTHSQSTPAADEKDQVDLHAWAEAYLPGAGWVGFDATSGLLAGEGHIPLACAATPQLAAPVIGSSEPAAVALDFSMSLQRLHEAD